MGKTIENYIEKLKNRIKHLEHSQDEYEKEYAEQKKEQAKYCDQYYVNSTEILTLNVIIRDLSKLTIHEYSYWDI